MFHPWFLNFLKKFWAPVPWMLEITITLQVILNKPTTAALLCLLLVINVSVSYAQERHAAKLLAALPHFHQGAWHSQTGALIFKVVKVLFLYVTVLSLSILFYGVRFDLPYAMILPVVLILLIAAIPVALPMTLVLCVSRGLLDLAQQGIVVTRVSELENASLMERATPLVETSRRIFHCLHTYTLNKISRSIEVATFTALGVFITGEPILTPLLMVLLMFSNDFVSMALCTDKASFLPHPHLESLSALLWKGGVIGYLTLLLSLGLLLLERTYLHLPLPQLQTFVFLILAFTSQTNIFILRERGYFWQSRPSRWLLLNGLLGITVLSGMAIFGILMAPVPLLWVLALLTVIGLNFIVVDFIKVPIYALISRRG